MIGNVIVSRVEWTVILLNGYVVKLYYRYLRLCQYSWADHNLLSALCISQVRDSQVVKVLRKHY